MQRTVQEVRMECAERQKELNAIRQSWTEKHLEYKKWLADYKRRIKDDEHDRLEKIQPDLCPARI